MWRQWPNCLWRWKRQCSETSEYKIQTPGNYPEESVQYSEHGESLKSRILHIHGEEVILHTYLPMKMEQCFETSEYKIRTPGNHPEESIQHSEHGESFEIKNTSHPWGGSNSSYISAYEDGTEFRNVGIYNSDARELPRRKHTTYRTWR